MTINSATTTEMIKNHDIVNVVNVDHIAAPEVANMTDPLF
jgi:hypothetical protein